MYFSITMRSKDHLLAFLGCGRVVVWRISLRYFGGGDERRLGQGEVLDALSEEGFGRRLDTVGAMSEVDRVAVRFQDLRLGVAPLELRGKVCFLYLSRYRNLISDDGVFYILLRERRSSFGNPVLGYI